MYTKPINRYRQFHLPNQTVSLAKVEKDPKYSQPGYDWLTRIEREGTEGSCVVVRSSTEALDGHYTTFVFGRRRPWGSLARWLFWGLDGGEVGKSSGARLCVLSC